MHTVRVVRYSSVAAAALLAAACAGGAEPIDTAKHWDVSTAAQESTATRTRICLNGFWQFRAVKDASDATALSDGKWFFLKVPGGFRRCYCIYEQNGKVWAQQDEVLEGKDNFGLYRRTFRLEKALEGCRAFLDFDAIMDAGAIFVNGRKVGELKPNPNIGQGKVDITGAAKFGAENEVRVIVTPQKDAEPWKRQAGVAADVWLKAEPNGPRIEAPFLHTSVRNRRLHAAFDVAGDGAGGKAYSLEAEVRSADGKASVAALGALAPSKGAGGRLEAAFDLAPHWGKLQLWNHENPRLYRVVLRLKDGGKLLDEASERIGFCETWVEGKDLIWNGRPLHRRASYRLEEKILGDGRQDGYTDRRCLRESLKLYKKAGYNALTCEYSYGPQLRNLMDACDEMGVYVWISCLPSYRESLFENKPPPDQLFAQIPPVVRRYWNHPSLGVWGCWFSGGFGTDEDTRVPHAWTTEITATVLDTAKHWAFCEKSGEAIRKTDPTRPVMFGVGQQVGDAITAYLYPCFGTPVQEVESWPRKWHADKPGKPFWVLESTMYYYATWYNMREVREDSKADNHVYEQAARCLGPAAYFMGPDDDPAPYVAESPPVTKGDTSVGNVVLHDKLPKAFLDTQLMLSTRAYRAWRAFGFATIYAGDELQNCFHTFRAKDAEIRVHEKFRLPNEELKKPGPVCDWYYWNERFVNIAEPGLPFAAPVSAIHDRFRDNAWGPFLAFLAHKGATFADFTRKDHAYAEGETIAKQVVLINDHTDKRKVRFSVAFAAKDAAQGRTAASGEFEMESGEIRFVPFEVKAPEAAERTEHALRLTASIEDGETAKIPDNPAAESLASFPKERRDEMAIEVWPKAGATAPKNLKVALYDEKGVTRKELDRLGIRASDFAAAGDIGGANLVVVGRESLTHRFGEAAAARKLAEKIESGAVDLLVFEQTRESAPSIGPDLDDLSIRDTFPLGAAHSVLDGLRERDFRDWRGDSDLIPAMPEDYFCFKPGTLRFPKWTNEGVVCSYVLRKPEYGNFRPLVEADFDLWGSPLLECQSGKGVAIFCQMDVTGRDDPAARRLLANIVKYLDARASGPKADPFRPVYFLGGGVGSEILKRRGIAAKPFDAAAAVPGTLIVAGIGKDELAAQAAAVKGFAERGGDVLYLVDSPDNFAASLLPGSVKASKSDAFRFKLAGGQDVTSFVGQGDLAFSSPPGIAVYSGDGKALAEPAAVCEAKHGKGRFVIAPLLDPDKYSGKWEAAKIERLYSTLLTNLGVRQAPPDLDFPAEKPAHDPASGRAYWGFEQDMGGWTGGKPVGEGSWRGTKCVRLESLKSNDPWDRAHIEIEAPAGKGGIMKLSKDPWFSFACRTDGTPFVIITVQTDKSKFEFEYRMSANQWVPLSMPLSNFSHAPKDLSGQTLVGLRIRWGGLADTKRDVNMLCDEIRIGPGPKSVFRRHPRPPTYDPNMYVTW